MNLFYNKGNIEKKNAIVFIFILLLSCFITYFSADFILKLRGIRDYDDANTSVRIHITQEKSKKSFGHQMRIVNVTINDEHLDLSLYDNDYWKWHSDWGYTFYESGDEDYYIEYKEPIKKFALEYVLQQDSGNAKVFVGDEEIKDLKMYNSQWVSRNTITSFLNKKEKTIEKIKLAIYICVILLVFWYALCDIMDKDKKRGVSSKLGMFDTAKGFSIVIIVLGHSMAAAQNTYTDSSGGILMLIFGVLFGNGLMPMFYIISGYGFRKEKVSVCIKKQLKFLLKPYSVLVVVTMVISVIKAFLMDGYTFVDVRNQLISFLMFNTVDSNVFGFDLVAVGAIWFCITLCVAWILLDIIFMLKNEKVIFLAVASTLIIGVLLHKLPFNIYTRTQFITAIPYLYTGYLLRDKKILQKENRFTLLKYIGLSIFVIALILYNGICTAMNNDLGKNYAIGVISCIGTGLILVRLYFLINSKFKMKLFKKIGRITYDIIYIHSLEAIVIPWKDVAQMIHIPLVLKCLLIAAIRGIIIFVIYRILIMIRKIKISKKGV